jgi:hypothetical protein
MPAVFAAVVAKKRTIHCLVLTKDIFEEDFQPL